MASRGKYVTSNFICPECGFTMPLPRPVAEQREKGHIKDLYCPTCKKVQKMAEYSEKESMKIGREKDSVKELMHKSLKTKHYSLLAKKFSIDEEAFIQMLVKHDYDLNELYEKLISIEQDDERATEILDFMESLYIFD